MSSEQTITYELLAQLLEKQRQDFNDHPRGLTTPGEAANVKARENP
jgi:hypothetical protein